MSRRYSNLGEYPPIVRTARLEREERSLVRTFDKPRCRARIHFVVIHLEPLDPFTRRGRPVHGRRERVQILSILVMILFGDSSYNERKRELRSAPDKVLRVPGNRLT